MKDLRAYLFDVIKTVGRLEEIAKGKSLVDFEEISFRWAVERGLVIVGEALYFARKFKPDLAVSYLNKIIATRHLLVHDYDRVDTDQLFVIIQKYLPVPKTEVQSILAQMNAES